MIVFFLDALPAFNIQRTQVVETDKQDLGPPSQTITYMNRRSIAAGHFFFTIWTGMYFVIITWITIEHYKTPWVKNGKISIEKKPF
jgi:hypothetical protein